MPEKKAKLGLVGLLLSLLLLYGLYPLLRASPLGGLFVNLFLSATFFAGVYAAGATKRGMIIMLFLGGPAFVLAWLFQLRPWTPLGVAAVLLSMTFVAYMIYLLLRAIHLARRVTSDLLVASACVYLLIGLFWAFAYILVVAVQPGAFHAPHVAQLIQEGGVRMVGISVFLYYSVVCMTTLGFGDIVPVTPIAQTLSSLEAIVGQLYLAILLGRVVGMYVAHSTTAAARESGDACAEEECIR